MTDTFPGNIVDNKSGAASGGTPSAVFVGCIDSPVRNDQLRIRLSSPAANTKVSAGSTAIPYKTDSACCVVFAQTTH